MNSLKCENNRYVWLFQFINICLKKGHREEERKEENDWWFFIRIECCFVFCCLWGCGMWMNLIDQKTIIWGCFNEGILFWMKMFWEWEGQHHFVNLKSAFSLSCWVIGFFEVWFNLSKLHFRFSYLLNFNFNLLFFVFQFSFWHFQSIFSFLQSFEVRCFSTWNTGNSNVNWWCGKFSFKGER